MVAIWVFAFLLYCPAILFWEHVAGHSVVAADQCYAEFFDNWYFLLCASTLEFFVPLLLVTYFNMHIFHNIQRRQRRGSVQDCEPPRSSSSSWRFCGLPRPGASSPSSEAEDSVSSLTRSWRPAVVANGPSRTETSSTALKRNFSASFSSKAGSKLQRDKKIAKSLAIIVCVFAICWAPYSLLMIIRGACQGKCIHSSLYEATFWLLWINSIYRTAFSLALTEHRYLDRSHPSVLCLCDQPRVSMAWGTEGHSFFCINTWDSTLISETASRSHPYCAGN